MFYLSAELVNGKLMRWCSKKTVAGNGGFRGEIPITNIRVIYGGLAWAGRALQSIDFYWKNCKKSIRTLETRT